MRLLSIPSAGLFADTVNDVDSTRKVYLLAGGLAALGIGLIAITVWFWRNTRHDPELLAPLEVMGAKGFHKLDGRGRQELLDSARPPDAEPMQWGVTRSESGPTPEVVDLRAIAKSARSAGYDDLRDDAVAVEASAGVDDVADAAGDEFVGADSMSAESSDVDFVASVGHVVDDDVAVSADRAGPDVESTTDDIAEEAVAKKTEPELQDPPAGPGAATVDEATVDETTVDETTVDEATVDETAQTEIDKVAILDATLASAESAGEDPATPPEPIPLLIVPIDHDLEIGSKRTARESVSQSSPASASSGSPDRSASIDHSGADTPEPPIRDVKPSIDPLIRKFDRNDR